MLQFYFDAWRLFTEEAVATGMHADDFYTCRAKQMLLRIWQKAAGKQRV